MAEKASERPGTMKVAAYDGSVSYTHLDVYKIQVFIIKHEIEADFKAAIGDRLSKVMDAVSYTHLDVYKRQQ